MAAKVAFSATLALRIPARLATASTHDFKAELFTGRVSITLAAS
jgi:hypothetical protein